MGVLDNDYAVMVGAPSAFRDVAEQKIQNFTLQQAADQQTIADLKQQLADVSAKELGDKIVIADLRVQLAATAGPLGDILILRDLQKWNDPVTGWQPPQVSAAIGAQGNLPVVYTRSWDANGNLVLNTTGKPGENSDWLTALHIPNVVTPKTRAAVIAWNFFVDDTQKFVQCHEQDALFTAASGFFNGSLQWNSQAGQLQIEAGPDANGKGSWMNCGLAVPRLSAGHHSVETLYLIDQAAKTIQYAFITVDGVRNVIPASVGVRRAFAPSWTPGKLHLQAQEDANSQGGSFQTVFDSIWAVIL